MTSYNATPSFLRAMSANDESVVTVTGDEHKGQRISRFASGKLKVSFSIPEGEELLDTKKAIGKIAMGIGLALARNDNRSS